MSQQYHLLRQREVADIYKLSVYREHGGYLGLETALNMEPKEVTTWVTNSGLRGRGGAGFPTGRKWAGVSPDAKDVIVLCNADESEPGTFKDREIVDGNPHQLIEGLLIAAYAVHARRIYIYFRGEFQSQYERFLVAVQEAYEAGYLGKNAMGFKHGVELYAYRGAGAYICGEQSALMDSLEGKRGYPRLRTSHANERGLYGLPTVINNVETFANVPLILRHGVDWYRSIGTEKSTGPKVYSVSGHVKRPGNYELPMGTPLRVLLDELAGGPLPGRTYKSIIPGGSSVPTLTANDLDVGLDFESMLHAGSLLGSGGVIVLDDRACLVQAALNLAVFYRHESCGKCTPCREGTYWLEEVLYRMEHGQGHIGDLDTLKQVTSRIYGNCFCPLGDSATEFVASAIRKFPDEFAAHIGVQGCPLGGVLA